MDRLSNTSPKLKAQTKPAPVVVRCLTPVNSSVQGQVRQVELTISVFISPALVSASAHHVERPCGEFKCSRPTSNSTHVMKFTDPKTQTEDMTTREDDF